MPGERERQRAKRFTCPICDAEVDPAAGEHLPFCSYRCKAVDMHNWLDGSYQPPTAEEEEDAGAGEPPED